MKKKKKLSLVSSTSLPGGNLVDGLPPALSRKFFEIFLWFPRNSVQGFCSNRELSISKDLKNLKIRATYSRKIGHYVKLKIFFLYHETFFVKKWKIWKKIAHHGAQHSPLSLCPGGPSEEKIVSTQSYVSVSESKNLSSDL